MHAPEDQVRWKAVIRLWMLTPAGRAGKPPTPRLLGPFFLQESVRNALGNIAPHWCFARARTERASEGFIRALMSCAGLDSPFDTRAMEVAMEPQVAARSVFISYRRTDTRPFVDELSRAAIATMPTLQVFRDADSIEVGEDFVDRIIEAVLKADVILVVIGPRWMERTPEGKLRLEDPADYVRMEIELALRNDKRIIPVLIGGAGLPSESELPPKIAKLSHRQAWQIRQENEEQDVAALLVIVERIRAEEAERMKRPPEPPSARAYFKAILPIIIRESQPRVLGELMALHRKVMFHVVGEGGGDWTLHLAPPQVRLEEGASSDADLTITVDEVEVVKMLAGEGFDAADAVGRGAVRLVGDVRLLQQVGRFMRV